MVALFHADKRSTDRRDKGYKLRSAAAVRTRLKSDKYMDKAIKCSQ
jgi:hypothetical protein